MTHSPARVFAGLFAGLLLLAPIGTVATATAQGTAITSNTVLRVVAPPGTATVGLERAESERGSAALRGLARFTTAQTPDATVRKVEREGSSRGDSGSDQAAAGAFDAGLIAGTLLAVSAGVELTDRHAESITDAELADLTLLGGLVSFSGLSSVARTTVDDDSATAVRTVQLDGLDLLRIGDLMDQLGVDPFALSCEAIESAGATLAISVASTCEDVAAAAAALRETAAILNDAAADLAGITAGLTEGGVSGDRDTAATSGTACDLIADPLGYPTCVANALADLVVLATTYEVTLSNPTDLDATRDEVVAALDVLLAAFADLGLLSSTDPGDTCSSGAAAIDDVEAQVSGADPSGVVAALVAAGVENALNDACEGARAAVDTLRGTPLVRLDGVQIRVEATADADEPTTSVEASIGSVAIGLGSATEVSLEEDVEAVLATVTSALGSIIEELLGSFAVVPTPDVDLLVVDEEVGQNPDGSTFARASLSTVRITLHGASLDVPEGGDRPLSILDEGASFASLGAGVPVGLGVPAGAMLAAIVETDDVVVEAGVFDSASDFSPAGSTNEDEDEDEDDPDPDSDDGDDGDDEGGAGAGPGGGKGGRTLPITGTDDRLFVAGLTALILAALLRRYVLL